MRVGDTQRHEQRLLDTVGQPPKKMTGLVGVPVAHEHGTHQRAKRLCRGDPFQNARPSDPPPSASVLLQAAAPGKLPRTRVPARLRLRVTAVDCPPDWTVATQSRWAGAPTCVSASAAAGLHIVR